MPSLLKSSRKNRLEEKVQFRHCQNPDCKKKFSDDERKSGSYLCLKCAVEAASNMNYQGKKKKVKKQKNKDLDEFGDESLIDPRLLK